MASKKEKIQPRAPFSLQDFKFKKFTCTITQFSL
ncbi:hypothetical protein VPHD51_0070 [Vibrio phage D51]